MPFAGNSRATVSTVLCAAALALGIASCGGKSGASGAGTKSTAAARSATGQAGSAHSTGPPLSRKQLIARADEICRRANVGLKRSEAQAKAAGRLRKPEEHSAVIAGNQRIEERAIKELAELKPPNELVGAWKEMTLDRQALARQLGVLATATQLRVADLSQLAAAKQKFHSKLRQAGRKAGFKDCTKVG